MEPQNRFLYFPPEVVRGIQEREAKEKRKQILGKIAKYTAIGSIAAVLVTGAGTLAINAAKKASASLTDRLSHVETLPDGRIKYFGETYLTKQHTLTGNENLMEVAAKMSGKKWDEDTRTLIFALNGGDRTYKPGERVTIAYQR